MQLNIANMLRSLTSMIKTEATSLQTAAWVLSTKPLRPGKQYYWKVKVIEKRLHYFDRAFDLPNLE